MGQMNQIFKDGKLVGMLSRFNMYATKLNLICFKSVSEIIDIECLMIVGIDGIGHDDDAKF